MCCVSDMKSIFSLPVLNDYYNVHRPLSNSNNSNNNDNNENVNENENSNHH